MTVQTIPDTSRSDITGVTATTGRRPTVNPHAAIGAVVLWLRDEGISLAGADHGAEACRRRVGLMRELLHDFGVDPATAVERAARHADAMAGAR